MSDFSLRQSWPAYQEMLVRTNRFPKESTDIHQLHRNSLPIARHRDEIIAILEESQILVLCGETGW